MAAWTADDSTAAIAEGWDIFTCDGSDNGPFQLSRFDEPEDPHWGWGDKPYPFAEDADAWVHVWDQAEAGSDLHQRALAFLAEENPMERQAIEDHMTVVYGERRAYLPCKHCSWPVERCTDAHPLGTVCRGWKHVSADPLLFHNIVCHNQETTAGFTVAEPITEEI